MKVREVGMFSLTCFVCFYGNQPSGTGNGRNPNITKRIKYVIG